MKAWHKRDKTPENRRDGYKRRKNAVDLIVQKLVSKSTKDENTLKYINCFLYINDLPLTVRDGQLVLFADDINLLIIERDENVLQHKVNEVMKKLEY